MSFSYLKEFKELPYYQSQDELTKCCQNRSTSKSEPHKLSSEQMIIQNVHLSKFHCYLYQ